MTQRQLLIVLLVVLGVTLLMAAGSILGAANPLVTQFSHQ